MSAFCTVRQPFHHGDRAAQVQPLGNAIGCRRPRRKVRAAVMAGAAQRAKHRAVVHRLRGRIEALISPIGAMAIMPPLIITVAGFHAEEAGTRPRGQPAYPPQWIRLLCAMPWVSAGLMVYLAM
ncbi:hypothetical protein LNQ52_13180 [Klebsiella pneumoniae subsp. pneumoniae]|nr:hypothetical protein [Klebsiella pneumoniae subsp. pneumoniae]